MCGVGGATGKVSLACARGLNCGCCCVQNEVTALTQQLTSAKADSSKFSSDISSRDAANKKLQAELASMTKQLESEKSATESAVAEKEQQLQAATAERDSLQQELSAMAAQIISERQKRDAAVAEVEQQLKAAKKQLSALSAEKSALEDTKADFVRQLDRMTQHLDSTEVSVTSLAVCCCLHLAFPACWLLSMLLVGTAPCCLLLAMPLLISLLVVVDSVAACCC